MSSELVTQQPLVEAIGLSKEFPRAGGPKLTVRGVNISILPGQTYGLMGLTGAGKSTVVGIMAGLMSPTTGSIRVKGSEVTPEKLRAQVALALGSDKGFYDNLTMLENLVFVAGLLGVERRAATERSHEVLDLVGLKNSTDKWYSKLSSGQRRQAHLARALLVKRPLLIADEPTRGLDPATEDKIVKLLVKIKKGGQTMLVVTHDPNLASSLCDWVGILSAGEIIREGSPLDLVHILTADRIHIRFAANPGKFLYRLRHADILTELHVHDWDVHAYTHDAQKDLNFIVRLVAECEIPIEFIAMPEPGLEEVFLKVIAEQKHLEELAKNPVVEAPQ